MTGSPSSTASPPTVPGYRTPLTWVGLGMTAAIALVVPVAVVAIAHPAMTAALSLIAVGLVAALGDR